MDRANGPNVEANWNRVLLVYAPYIVIGLVLAIAIPASGASTGPLSRLVDAVSAVVPSINRLARLSHAPEMTRTFGALMWLMQPVFTAVALKYAPRTPLRQYSWWVLVFSVPMGLFCLLGLGVVFPFFFLDESPEQLGFSKGRGMAGLTLIMQTRFGHGTLGSVMFAFSSISQVLLIRSIFGYPRLVVHNIRLRFGYFTRP